MPRRRRVKEPEPVCTPTARDFVMARLAAARVNAQCALDELDEAMGHFVEPDADGDGEARDECLVTALEALGSASRGIEAAQEVWEEDGEVDPEEGEDYGDEDEEGDDESDDAEAGH